MSKEATKRLSPAALIWVAIAFAIGAFVRLYFISSHGSWDTDYWKAWAHATAESGVTQAYGGPDSVPPGEFLAQLSGRKPRWEVPFRDRDYVIDYPPIALTVWGESWRFFTAKPRPYRGPEAENLAVKFPSFAGDLLSVGLLIWAFRRDLPRGLLLASAYWVFPVTWVSSAIHGNLDGLLAPFLLLALLLSPRAPFMAGVVFAVSCLIKLTAAVALPALLLAASRRNWLRVIAGGAVATALILLPFALAGTIETALIHVVRIYSQERLSGGYANPWWLLGHASQVFRDAASWRDPIDYVRRSDFALPLGLMGFAAAALAAMFILFEARRITRSRSAVYVGALLLLVWGLLTTGVHDNHSHPVFLLLAATGLGTPFLRAFATTAATSTVIGSLCLHGLGRFYGPQWKSVLPIADNVTRMRMAPGFDITIVLGLLNCLLLAAALYRLRRTLTDLEAPPID